MSPIPATAATDCVSVIGVSKRFGETKALVDANLLAKSGEIHAIVGENGSGKSTLSKVLSGVVLPDQGTVSVFGARPTAPADAIGMGVATIYQEVLLAESLSVIDNLFAGHDGFWRRRSTTSMKRSVAKDLLDRMVGAPVDPDAQVSELSLSVKQWIVIARAILSEPRLLIVDESSAALDLDATTRLHGELRRLKAQGCCVLLVTHRIAELVQIADVATVLRDGVTVGRLEREEISEERLLALMSGTESSSSALKTSPRKKTQSPLLSVRGACLAPLGAAIYFRISAGEIVGLAGLDGAGHAAFASLLAGIDRPLTGDITVHGENDRPIRSLPAAIDAGIAYVSGDRRREGIFPKLSIIENFGMALLETHTRSRVFLDAGRRQQEFDVEARRLSIKYGRPSDRITTLSGGNQQKVLIARAFAQRPRCIVLNDPTRGVDIGTKKDLYRQLRDFAAEGGAVVYLSSEIEEFFDFADRVDVFFGGRIFASLKGADIAEHTLLNALFGHQRGDAFAAPWGVLA